MFRAGGIVNRYNIMLTKRQFLSLYDQAVLGVRSLKTNNDQLNRRADLNNDISLFYETQSDADGIGHIIKSTDALIARMESAYLDPDTSRKIGSIKQQLRIQKERRQQLLDTISEVTKTIGFRKQPSQPHHYEAMEIESGKSTGLRGLKRSQMSEESTENSEQQTSVVMESEFDYQMERKLIQEKHEHLGSVHQRINSIKDIALETSQMVYEQGENLDIIGDDLFESYQNVKYGNLELEEANKQHRKSRTKRVTLCMLLFVGLAAGVFLMFFV